MCSDLPCELALFIMTDTTRQKERQQGKPRKKNSRGRPEGKGSNSSSKRGSKRSRGAKGSGRGHRGLKLPAAPKLDLSLPVEKPFDPQELREVKSHLEFLRRYKQALRLSLNAKEDLLVNGVRDPEERGVIKHLLSKVDRNAIDQALAREPLKSDLSQRIRFLEGAVRLTPRVDALLNYLDALSRNTLQKDSRRDAARAFAWTVAKLDFSALTVAQTLQLLKVVEQTFVGAERISAVTGLLENPGFDDALQRTRAQLSPEAKALFLPLRAARKAVMNDGPLPQDESERILIDKGVAQWLSAPAELLSGYPQALRFKLIEHALRSEEAPRIPPALMDSLPKKSEQYAAFAMRWSSQLLVQHRDEEAASLLRQLLDVHPNHKEAAQRAQALSWPRRGRIAIAPTSKEDARLNLIRAFWLDGDAFVWARFGDKAVLQEADLQSALHISGVLPAIAKGKTKEGAFVAVLRQGRPLVHELPRLGLQARLSLTYDGLCLLRALSMAGIELPDASLGRFAVQGKGQPTLKLADFAGAKRAAPERCALQHQALVAPWCESMLSKVQAELPAELAAKLSRKTPLVLLAQTFARCLVSA